MNSMFDLNVKLAFTFTWLVDNADDCEIHIILRRTQKEV